MISHFNISDFFTDLKRQDYKTYSTLSDVPLNRYDLIQLKYDGIWAKLFVESSGLTHWLSRKNQEKHSELTNLPPGIYLGEFMFGSHWSQHHERKGKTYLFDIVWDGSNDLRNVKYSWRHNILYDRVSRKPSDKIHVIPNVDVSLAQACWKRVEDKGLEGLVFRSSKDYFSATLGRLKREVTVDYIAIGFLEGAGRLAGTLGTIVAGLYKEGSIVEVCRVGGGLSDSQRKDIWNVRDEFLHKVFTAKGNALFPDGALRHPNFVEWRDDKGVEECKI